MLNERPLQSNRAIPWLNQFGNWLVKPSVNLPPDRMRRSRLFNTFLLTELSLLLLATPLAIINRNSQRILLGVLIFLVGVVVAYVLGKAGQVDLAAWANGLGSLVALSYYIISTPRTTPVTIYYDFRSSVMLLALPIIITGVVAGARACIALTGLSLLIFIVIGVVEISNENILPQTGLSFYILLFLTPLSFLVMACFLSVIFERNIFGLFDRLTRRNKSLQENTERLAFKRQQLEQVAGELQTIVVKLKSSFEEQLYSSEEQQKAIVDVGAALEELGRVARRIDSLAGQASQVAQNAVAVATREADVIMTNGAAYGRLQQHLDLINHSIEELTVEARHIDQAVGSISEVAEETNLLALNASIEAAGNREHGRRFTTVAGEVQRLAQRSRDAADEVRRVAGQIEESVAMLAESSIESRERAVILSQSSRSSATTVDEIVKSVGSSARLGQQILGSVQGQQAAAIGIMDLMPSISTKSAEIRVSTHRLLQALHDLEQAVYNLSQGSEILLSAPPAEKTEAEESGWRNFLPIYSQRSINWNINWRRFWVGMNAASHQIPHHLRRRSRLLNTLCLCFSFFLIFYIPAQQLLSPRQALLVSLSFLLVGVIVTYVLNKLGYYVMALFCFFGSALGSFSAYIQLITKPFDIIDYIKTGSSTLGLIIMVAVIIAGLRSIIWTTGLAILLTILYAFQRVERSFIDMLPLLAYPTLLLISLGFLAAFLHNNISRLNEQLEHQNQRLTADNRELLLKERQEIELSLLINNLTGELSHSFEQQAQLASTQLQAIQEITRRIENLERDARTLVASTKEISQAAGEAKEHASKGAATMEEGLQIIEEFEYRITLISANSANLQMQASEIEQTFDLIIDVAEETDLLALNATVEASQARDAGKRFAAVASEVQRLAGRARAASATVRAVIARVEEAVALCVDLTRRGQFEIQILGQASQDTSLSIQEIVQTVSSANSLINQIGEAVQQQAAAIAQVLERLRDITAVGKIFKDTTRANSDTVVRLNAASNLLHSVAQKPELSIEGAISPN